MPNAARRATAPTLSKTNPDAAIIKRVNRRYNQPGLYERGLESLVDAQENAKNEAEVFALVAEFQELQPKISSVRKRLAPLEVAHDAIGMKHGFEKAAEWSTQSEHDALITDLSDLCLSETYLVDSMIKLQPKTLAGIAATAAAFKEDQAHFWKKPETDRDWEISLLTRFLDGLIDLGQAPRIVDRPLVAHGEAA
jgi:hypothetical protein